MERRRVAVITGANSGLGFTIACRILDSMGMSDPLTIVISTRHMRKAADTIVRLRAYMVQKKLKNEFLSFDYVLMDLGDLSTVCEVSDLLKERYSHIDYLFLNAGGGDFKGLDWIKSTKQVLTDPVGAMTLPDFKLEGVGKKSFDGVGWVFQINVFANYVLMHRLQSALQNGGRVIFIGSVEANMAKPFGSDIQLVETDNSYADSKKQVQCVHAALAHEWKQNYNISLYLTHPGVCQTAIFAEHLNFMTTVGMLVLFYFVRFLGCPWLVISAYKGALAPVYAALFHVESEEESSENTNFGSACDVWGKEYVKKLPTAADEDKKIGRQIVAEMEKLEAEKTASFFRDQ
ncbi:uncharacterized protein V1516DRAFT_668922 [Lipomyces oligophaga]|uniref:uncharacterized protein n=1 Tax=Lipomyces oligophaga TaxID=45792 RepID=UPI0034CF6FDF